MFLMAALAHADPENFMVSGFTFVRPPQWKWVWDERLANTGLRLRIEGSNTNDTAAVYFRSFTGEEGSPENRIKVWQQFFKESPDKVKIRTKMENVAGYPVIYLEMEGTSALETTPEFGLFAAIVKMKQGHLVVRMSRSKKVVNNSKTLFKEMVENALKEKQLD